MRSPLTGLLGNTLHTDSAEWLRKDSGIGAGIDSFYEYSLKVLILRNGHALCIARVFTAIMECTYVVKVRSCICVPSTIGHSACFVY